VKKRYVCLIVFCLCALVITVSGFALRTKPTEPEDYTLVDRPAEIRPDYTGTVIPPNIAPLNFLVIEPGERYLVKIHSAAGDGLTVSSRNGKIKIPASKWCSLLGKNRGNELFFDIYVETQDDRWSRYDTITNTIAKEDIDTYITYRFMTPSSYYNFKRIGVYQQNLENCDKSVVLVNSSFYGYGCVNCHTFVNNNADKMLISVRTADYGNGTLLVNNGGVSKIGTKFGYASWHPSGRLATYSINNVRQFFHLARQEVHDVLDLDSSIVYYLVDSQVVKTNDALADKDRLETYPAWTPDGKYLYFCSAPILWQDRNQVPPENYDKVKYDLRRISYDLQTNQWGEVETVLSADDTALSIMLPRISPDGRFLLFCMCDYGCFPVYQPSSDLYIMNLNTNEYHKLTEVNSEYSESLHSWSSNSRWFAFSSKRRGGLLTKIFFSYVDNDGKAYKPFVLPQKDPAFYDSLYKVYSVPELTTGPIKISHKDLARAACSNNKIDIDIPITTATPTTGPQESESRRQFQ
jgi:hypothetical protein